MKVGPVHPKMIRAEFARRPWTDLYWISAGLIAAILLFSNFGYLFGLGFLGPLLIDALLVVVAYGCYQAAQSRPLEFKCTHCDKHIDSKTPWTCGFCDAANTNIDEFPFIHRCERCGSEPKAYKCHHKGCSTLNFLGNDHLEENYAFCLNSTPEEPAPDPREEEVRKQSEEKADTEAQIIQAELTAKLEEVKLRNERLKPKTERERVQADFEKFKEELFSAEDFVAQELAKIEADPNLDPDKKQKRKEAIRAWQLSRLK